MSKIKNENKLLLLISICIFALIIILLVIFEVIAPNTESKEVNNNNYIANNEILTKDNMYTPSENEWITLQLSRRRN